MVLKKGRFGPFLACTRYPECKETRRLVRGEGGKLQVEVLGTHRREVPRLRQRPHVAARAFRSVHRLQQLPRLQVHQEEGSQGDRAALPGVQPGPGGRAQGAVGTVVLRLPPLPRVQVHRLSPSDLRALPRLRPRRTCSRRRPRRKARSSSAATRPATSSARPPEPVSRGPSSPAAYTESMTQARVTIVGGGLAGCEAAWQLARRGDRASTSSRCARCGPPRCTRPPTSPSSCARTASAATPSTRPRACSRRRCAGSTRWSCASPTR